MVLEASSGLLLRSVDTTMDRSPQRHKGHEELTKYIIIICELDQGVRRFLRFGGIDIEKSLV